MQVRDYWNYREEISLHNGLLFKSQRVIVPKAMRSEILSRIHSSHQGIVSCLKARLHRRFLSRQFDTIFVAPKLQLQNRTCKPGAIFSAICRRDIAGVSNMFETCCNLSATKIASSCRDEHRLCKRALRKAKDIVKGVSF